MQLWDCQVTSAGALSIALQHPALTGDLETVCSLLQTCKSWRAALQQCSAGHLTIHTACSISHALTRHSRIAVWLPKHCGLVGELVVHNGASEKLNQLADESAAAEQVLALSVQHAATRAAAAAEAAPLLRLRSVTLFPLQSPALLQALPAGALTQLSLTYHKVGRTHLSLNSSAITLALTQLTALQQLHLSALNQQDSWIQDACLAAVGQLLQLTQLHMCCVALGSDLSLLPRQLRQLVLQVACEDDEDSSSSSTAVAFGHLSALQQLHLKLDGTPALSSCLPAGLTELTVQGAGSDAGCGCSSMQHLSIAPLQQLRELCLQDVVVDVRELQALSKVLALSSITVSYGCLKHASDTAPIWRHLPALESLTLVNLCLSGPDEPDNDDEPALDPLDKAASLAVLECLAAATSLTQLQLFGSEKQPEEAWCGYLTSLQQLRHLELGEQLPYDRADVLQLTALTNLTSLTIGSVAAVDDAAAAALALRLTKLRQLALAGVGLSSAAALPVIAALTGLTRLRMWSLGKMLPALSRDDLMLLTPLTQLRWLHVSSLFAEGVVDELWDAEGRMWRQQQQ